MIEFLFGTIGGAFLWGTLVGMRIGFLIGRINK